MNQRSIFKGARNYSNQQLLVIESQQQPPQGNIVQEGEYDVEKDLIFEEEKVSQSQKLQKQHDGLFRNHERPELNLDGQQNYLVLLPQIKNLVRNQKNKQNRLQPENTERLSIVDNIHIKQNDQKTFEFPNKHNGQKFNIDNERSPPQQSQGQINPEQLNKISEVDENVYFVQSKAQSVGRNNDEEIISHQDETPKHDAKIHPEIPIVNGENYISLQGTNREPVSFIRNRRILPLLPPKQRKNYFKILKEFLIFIITLIEIILTFQFWFLGFNTFEVEDIQKAQNQTNVFQMLKFIYVFNISFTIILHIVSWIYIDQYMKNNQYSFLKSFQYLFISALMGFFSYFKITPFLVYFSSQSNRNSHQLTYNQVEKYFSYSKHQNPTILFKKHNKTINIFRDFIYLRTAKFSMMLMVLSQTIPQIFLQTTFNIYFEQWNPFNKISLIILICSALQGIHLLLQFSFRQLKQNFNQLPQLNMNQIIIQSEYELKQLSKAIQDLSNKNIKFFISINLKANIQKNYQELNKLIQITYFKNVKSIKEQVFDITQLQQTSQLINQSYYFYSENSPRNFCQTKNLNTQSQIYILFRNSQKNVNKCKLWSIQIFENIRQTISTNDFLKKILFIFIVLWHLFFFIWQPIILFSTINVITKIASSFSILIILIKLIWFSTFYNNHQLPNYSVLENFKFTVLFFFYRITGLWNYASNNSSFSIEEKKEEYDLNTFQIFQKYVIKYQKILALTKLKNKKFTVSKITPFIYQTLWRDYVFIGIYKIIIIYGILFIINYEFPIILPILLTYQIFEEILSNYYLITEAAIQNVIPALILSQNTFNHFLESMMIFMDLQSEIQIENPKFIKKLNKLSDQILQQYPIEINVDEIGNVDDTNVIEQISQSFNHIQTLELKSAEQFKNYSSYDNPNKVLAQLQKSKIQDLKLNFKLNSQNINVKQLNKQLNHILQFVPQNLQYLHICIENAISTDNLILELKHLQNLLGFKFTFVQSLTENNQSEKPNISLNETFLQLDKSSFKKLNLEFNANLGLTAFNNCFKQFTEYEELNLKIIVQDSIQTYQRDIFFDDLQFSSNLISLTLFFQNLRIYFGQNFGKVTEKLKYFKFISIQCHIIIDEFVMAISKMNKESYIILDFNQQELDENDLARINDAIKSRS